MDFNFENNGTWFYFDEEDETKGGVCLRTVTPEEARKISKRTTRNKVEYKRNQRFEYSVIDEDLNISLILDYCIIDWKNVNANGKELECNTKNKKELLSKSICFSNFITSKLDYLNELSELEIEDQKKI